MKKLITLVVVLFITVSSFSQQQQQPQESSSRIKLDTVKFVAQQYHDPYLLQVVPVRLYAIIDFRKGDETGKDYQIVKCWLNENKEPVSQAEIGLYFNIAAFAWLKQGEKYPSTKEVPLKTKP